MTIRFMIRAMAGCLAAVCCSSFAFADAADTQLGEAAAATVETTNDWRVILGIPAWIPWTTGTMQIGPLTVDADLTGQEALEELQSFFAGQFEVIYQEQYTFLIENYYVNIGSTDKFGRGGEATLGFRESITDARLGYRAINNPDGWLEVYVGVRWWDVSPSSTVTTQEIILRPSIGPRGGIDPTIDVKSRTFTEATGDSWVDPIIGLRTQYDINDRWYLTALGDIGGFDVGSDFAWRIQLGGGYRFSEHWTFDLQYKAISVDYDNNKSGSDRFGYDVLQQGPLFRVRYIF